MRVLYGALALLSLAGCAGRGVSLDAPREAARHRAALASVTANNQTTLPLTIAFRTATAPIQEVVIGSVAAGARTRMAPVPAGEPIILVARREDGMEYGSAARSLPLDAEVVWDIPRDAAFRAPERQK